MTLQPSWTWAQNVDDVLLILALVVAIPRLWRANGLYVLVVAFYSALMVVALIRSSVSAAITLELFRASMIPAVLLLIGLVLSAREFRNAALTWLAMSTFNALYMLAEMFGFRMIDPVRFYSAIGSQTHIYEAYHGMPGAYLYWSDDGSVALRAGGIVMNPPIAGTMVAIGAVIAFHLVKRVSVKFLLVGINLLALWASQGRGGAVIVAIGLVLPIIVRKVGVPLAFGLLLPFGIVAYGRFSSAGDSVSHVEGFVHGVSVSLTKLFGDGFGTAGNAVKLTLRNEESSESLVGIVLVAGGTMSLVVVLALVIALLRRVRRGSDAWAQYLGLAALISAFFSESSGALAGAAFMWLALGAALGTPIARVPSDGRARSDSLRP
ncbi:hypothetical protein IM711_04930 [Microbacterium esteraromaticum]|uniref:hypothetical protein n=1 Tax=Microbacterium esteraromaticum TaxID=57043 RepID=UPI003C2ED0D8